MFQTSFACAEDWKVFTAFDSLTVSESFSIHDILTDVEGGGFKRGGSDAYTHNQLTAGVRKGGWELAALTRFDYIVDYTSDTADLLFASETESMVPDGAYDILVNINHSRSSGFRLGYTYDINPHLAVTGRVSGLIANNIIDGDVSGNLTLLDGEVESGALGLDYAFTEDIAFDRVFESNTGHGFTLDAIIDWQISDKLKGQFGAYDFVSNIWWDNLTQTVADATTAVASTGDNGILLVRPILSGQNFFEPFEQRLRGRYVARVDYQLNNKWRLSQDIFRTGDNHLTLSEAGYKLSNDLELSANVEWVSKALGGRVSWKFFEIGLASDNLSFKRARYAKVHAGFKVDF